MLAVILFIAFLAWFLFFLYRHINARNKKEELDRQSVEIQKANIVAKQHAEEVQKNIVEKMLQIITSDFEELEWNDWDESIHRANGQIDRLRRAVEAMETSNMTLVNFAPNGYAKIKGTQSDYYLLNKHRCSCPDFRNRHIPCKHMYYLAIASPEYEQFISDQSVDLPDFCYDTTLYGLRFSIAGRGQEKVKQYIVRHAGTFGDDTRRSTSAVVSADGLKTERIYDALSKNIEVLSVNDLKCIVKEWGGVDLE